MRPIHLYIVFMALVLFNSGCKQKETINLPNIQDLYTNIDYLDSLLQSRSIDSIETVINKLDANIKLYYSQVQTPEDKVMIDSLIKINNAVDDFIRFCTDSQVNLELLKQDIASVETEYRSGKLEAGKYISVLMESEQIEVDIRNQFTSDYELVLAYLNNQELITKRLSPLPSDIQN